MLNFRRMTMGFSLGSLLKTVAPIALTLMTGGAAAPMLMNMAIKMAAEVAIQKLGQELGLPPAITQMASAFLTGGMQGGTGAGGLDFGKMLQQGGLSAADVGQGMRMFDGMQNTITDFGRMALSSGVFNSEQSTSQFVDRFTGGVGNNPQIRDNMSRMDDILDRIDAARASGDTKLADKLGGEYDKLQRDNNKLVNSSLDITLGQSRSEAKKKMQAALQSAKSPMMRLAIILGMLADQKSDEMAKRAEALGQFGEVKGKNQGQYQQMTSELNALGQELNALIQAASNVIKTMGEASATMARKG
jgi:hypothetical protein